MGCKRPGGDIKRFAGSMRHQLGMRHIYAHLLEPGWSEDVSRTPLAAPTIRWTRCLVMSMWALSIMEQAVLFQTFRSVCCTACLLQAFCKWTTHQIATLQAQSMQRWVHFWT